VQAGLPSDITDTQRFTNSAIGHLLTEVIIPFAQRLSDKSKFGKSVQKAEDDLLGIAEKLWEDNDWGFNSTPRLFRELRLHPNIMDTALQAFVDVLSGVGALDWLRGRLTSVRFWWRSAQMVSSSFNCRLWRLVALPFHGDIKNPSLMRF
jgi:hypothetical protein